jgi:hypothetical protein
MSPGELNRRWKSSVKIRQFLYAGISGNFGTTNCLLDQLARLERLPGGASSNSRPSKFAVRSDCQAVN